MTSRKVTFKQYMLMRLHCGDANTAQIKSTAFVLLADI